MNPGFPLWPSLGTVTCDMGAYGGYGWTGYTGLSESCSHPVSGDTYFSISPNPIRATATVSMSYPPGSNPSIVLYDLSGRRIMGPMTHEPVGTSLIDLSSLSPGTYLFAVQWEDMISSVKFMKVN